MRETPSGERFRDPTSPLRGYVETGRNHPYAEDLDVFGPGSLFQLLSSCRTPMGEERLAGWLLRPAAIPDIRERQARVAAGKVPELVDLLEQRRARWDISYVCVPAAAMLSFAPVVERWTGR